MLNLYGRNRTSDTILVSSWKIYSTTSTSVSVIDVQSLLDDNLFNAYKFIYNQVPYYYVVDELHNYWVSDLSSIGYKLYEEPSYEFILVENSTGRLTHGVESLNQIEFSSTGYFLIESDNDVIFVVELPTVSTTGDFNTDNWLYANTGGTNVSVLSGNSVLIGTGGSVSPIPVDYDTTKSYSVIEWGTYQSAQGSGHTEYSIISSNDKIYAQNETSGDLYLYAIRVAVCSSNQASVVTVYNSSNTAYNAFKYTIDNLDYYYVLDEIQTAWTNDLSSIGYSDVPFVVLPTVSVDLRFSSSNKSTAKQISSTMGTFWYDENSADVMYQSGWKYLLIKYYTSTGDNTGSTNSIEYCYFEDREGRLFTGSSIPNYGYINVQRAEIASCSDSMATIVTVYDNQNTIYKSFKFTVNGTDYYYILDGIQADWTDDLAEIGYSLAKRAYLTTSPHSDKYLNEYVQYSIVDENNNHIPYDSSRSYILTGTYKVSGSVVIGNVSLTSGDDGHGTTILKLYNGSPRVQVGYIEYIVS